jgi:CDP-glucose 4,6-dehydratase
MAGRLPLNPDFWYGRRVLLTGHTGFKGAWTSALLDHLGALVTGVGLEAEPGPNLWRLFNDRLTVASIICDIRDGAALAEVCRRAKPQVVLHMAAQAKVREGYRAPAETYATNLMGTVHLLEGLRQLDGIEAVLVITSDKVYRNEDQDVPHRERHALGGADPYSGSKAAAEIAAHCYAESFFAPRGVPLATARGGNVLGGGDFGSDRLVPDIFRAACRGEPVRLRYPQARRPWQHVLDCLCGYLRYAEYLHGKRAADPPALNFGPTPEAQTRPDMTVAEIAEAVGLRLGSGPTWQHMPSDDMREWEVLQLDCAAAQNVLGWSPRLHGADVVEWTAEWYAQFRQGRDPLDLVRSQIQRYAAEDL